MDGKHCKIEVTEEMIQELVDLTLTLTAIPAPSHHEEKRVEFVVDYLRKAGYENIIRDEAKNVIVEQKVGTEYHLYTAHTDTVFPDTTTLPVREEQGRLYGPGVGDDTANLAGMLLALKHIKKAGLKPKRSVAYVCDSGEEGLGNLRGMWVAFHRYEQELERHIAFDGSTDHIVNEAVGSRRYEVKVKTVGGHSYNAYGNRNAIEVAARMIGALYEIDTTVLSGKTTYNVGTIEGGTSVNTIAQEVTFRYEYRSNAQDSMAAMKKLAEEKMGQALKCEVTLEDGVSFTNGNQDATIEIKLIGDRPGMGAVDEKAQAELSEHLADLLEKHTGNRPDYNSGSTDCNIPLSHGIIAACFGIYLGALQHTREEYIERASLKAGMETMLELLLEDYE